MTTPDPRGRSLVGIQVGERRVDVAVPDGLALYEVLRSLDLDLDDPQLVVVDSAGRPLDLYARRSEPLADGAVLHVLRASPSGPRAVAGHAAGEPAASRPTAPWWWVLAAVGGAVLVATTLLAVGGGRWFDGATRGAVAATLLVAAVLATGVRDPRAATWVTVGGWVTSASAGVVAVDPSVTGASRLAVVMGLVAATAVTAVRWALARRVREDAADVALVLLVWSSTAAALTAGTLLVGAPAAVAAATLLGLLPVALRSLPSLAVDVPDEQLLDLTLVERTVSTVRRPARRPLGPVNPRAVQRTVASAERRRDAGTVVVGILAPLAGGVLLLQAPAGTVPRVASLAAGVLVVLALLLHPRAARGSAVRWAPRIGALLLLGAVLAGMARGGVPAVMLAAGAVVLGLVWSLTALPLGRGWRSVGASRAGDTLEGLATALALPVALVGAGVVDLLRLATSA